MTIFISYSRADRLTVDRLFADLKKRGYALWMDVRVDGIELGENWRTELVKQMSDAEAVVACISPDFLKSPFCKAEIEQALREKKRIYPVIVRRLESGQSPAEYGLGDYQNADLTTGYDDGLARLIRVLPAPKISATIGRYALFGTIGAVILAVAFFFILSAVRTGTYIAPTDLPPTATPSLADIDMGVLVSYFQTEGGVDKDQADSLIRSLAARLAPDLKQTFADLKLTTDVLGPEGVDRVTGETPDVRENNARILAKTRDADIVLYGVIRLNKTTGAPEIQPEYYVSPVSFSDALDMTGSFRLGQDIPLTLPLKSALESRGELSGRVTALSQIIVGLTEYSSQNLQGSLKSFQQASSSPDWKSQDGREVIEVLLGNVYTKLAEMSGSACSRDGVLTNYYEAEKHYKAAISILPSYARPYNGLAGISYLRAIWDDPANDGCKDNAITSKYLDDGLAYLAQSREATDQPKEIGVQSRSLLTETLITYQLWLLSDTGSPKEAEYANQIIKVTVRIIRNYENGRYPSMSDLTAEAYLFRARFRFFSNAYRDALTELNAALAIPDIKPNRKMVFLTMQGDCYLQLGKFEAADTAYTDGLKIARELKNDAQIKIFIDQFTTLDAARKGQSTPTANSAVEQPNFVTATPTTEPSETPQ